MFTFTFIQDKMPFIALAKRPHRAIQHEILQLIAPLYIATILGVEKPGLCRFNCTLCSGHPGFAHHSR